MPPSRLPSGQQLRRVAYLAVFAAAVGVPLASSPNGEALRQLAPVAAALGQTEIKRPEQDSRRPKPLVVRRREAPPIRRAARRRVVLVSPPARGPVSSPFGWRRHPVSGRTRHHDGVDLAVPLGTTVRAVASGVVRSVGRRSGYGLVVEIDHRGALGTSHRRSLYAHLSSTRRGLRRGVRVRRGQPLGASGGVPGRDGTSTGPHLHFEVRDASGRPLDPAVLLRAGGRRERRADGSWQVMFSSGREPRPTRPRSGLRAQARAAFAPPVPAGSRGRSGLGHQGAR
ncbi:M23 family metallopeptidase [Rubrivirga sp. S365]|uniref:M23 family metallopeptidase n=1 Tax=Rubrivirga sp. S365 TaxID=3076080 RepID=UPI00391EEF25